jgi:PAS domain S-box-containing protein
MTVDDKRDGRPDGSGNDLAAREKMLDNRMLWIKAHESASATRDAAICDREEIVLLREAQVEARREAEAARDERERLLVRIREVNQNLLLASLKAQEAVDAANVARDAADENAERFRSLVLTSSAIVWRAAADGVLAVDPDVWRRFTGADLVPEDWGWLEQVHPSDRDRVRGAWANAVATATPYACQHRIRRRTGGYAWMMARAVPIARGRSVREWVGMMSDVSDRVRVEEAREQFISILGHDLRNPLASIVGGIELLRGLPEPHAQTIGRLARSAGRIEGIIRDLLDFARGRLGGGIPVAPRRCDLRLICDEVIEEMRRANGSRAIRFEATGDLRGEWDPDRIEQVISNLVGNAVSHGEGPIVLSCRAEPDHVIAAVTSRGRPIPEELIPTLFEPFTRAADDGHHDGLGLGLFIANEIVRAHGGTLAVASVEGEETVFTFALPRRAPARARTATYPEPIVG